MPRNPFDDSLPPLSTDTSEYGEFDPYQRKPLSRLTSPIALDTPPQYKQDKRGDMLGAFFATLGGLLGGNRDMAGQFGASFLQGRQAGRERNYQRDVQQWQNKRSNDIYANQQDVARTQQNNAITQQENNAARQFWADNRAMAGDERQVKERERMVPVQTTQNADRVLSTLRTLDPESAQAYLNSLDSAGHLKALGIEGFFTRGADGRLVVPQPRMNNAQSLNGELSFLKAGLSNRYATPETRSGLLERGLSLLGGRYSKTAQAPVFNLPVSATTTNPETLATAQAGQSPAPTQEPPKPGFYGMTPYEEAQFKVKQEQIRQSAARVDVAQKNLQTRKTQVQQQGEIAKARMGQQSEQFKQRMALGWANYQKKGTSGNAGLDAAFRDYGKIVAAQNRAYGIRDAGQRQNALADVDQMKEIFTQRYPDAATLVLEPGVDVTIGAEKWKEFIPSTKRIEFKPPAPKAAAPAPKATGQPRKAAPAPAPKGTSSPKPAATPAPVFKAGPKVEKNVKPKAGSKITVKSRTFTVTG